MKTTVRIEEAISILEELLNEADEILDMDFGLNTAVKWRTKVIRILTGAFGETHSWTVDFSSIAFKTAFTDGIDDTLLEDEYMMGLEDARSFVAALLDELESQEKNALGVMDMESVFAEITRYIAVHVRDKGMKENLNGRVMRLKNGILSGDISTDELSNHMQLINNIDVGLFERMAPLITWFYMHRDELYDFYNINN